MLLGMYALCMRDQSCYVCQLWQEKKDSSLVKQPTSGNKLGSPKVPCLKNLVFICHDGLTNLRSWIKVWSLWEEKKILKQSLSFKIEEQNYDFLWVPRWKQNVGLVNRKCIIICQYQKAQRDTGPDHTAQLLGRKQQLWAKYNKRLRSSPSGPDITQPPRRLTACSNSRPNDAAAVCWGRFSNRRPQFSARHGTKEKKNSFFFFF